MFALISARIPTKSLVLVALLAWTAAPGLAQTAPGPGASPTPTPAASGVPSGSSEKSGARTGVPTPTTPRKLNYVPSLDIIPQSSFSTGTDLTQGEPQTDGITRIGGKITESIVGNLNFSYAHGYIDETVGQAPAPGNYFVDDPIDDFRLNDALTHALGVSLGYFYRHRTCCPGAGETGNLQPISVHQAYLELDYAFPAIGALNGTVVSISARGTQTLAHQPTPASVLAAQPQLGPDQGNKFLPSGGLTVTVPIDPQHHLNFFGTYSYAFDYFNYQPIAWYYHIIDYGATRVVNPSLSFTADVTNLHQYRQGYPFPDFNVIHRAKFVLSADIHLGPH